MVFSQMYPPHPEGKKSVLQVLREAQHLQNTQKILGDGEQSHTCVSPYVPIPPSFVPR